VECQPIDLRTKLKTCSCWTSANIITAVLGNDMDEQNAEKCPYMRRDKSHRWELVVSVKALEGTIYSVVAGCLI
jgi:hypothetical protein